MSLDDLFDGGKRPEEEWELGRCKFCTKGFAYRKVINKKPRVFCSPSCSGKYSKETNGFYTEYRIPIKRYAWNPLKNPTPFSKPRISNKILVQCKNCNTDLYRWKSSYDLCRYKQFFCNLQCKGEFSRKQRYDDIYNEVADANTIVKKNIGTKNLQCCECGYNKRKEFLNVYYLTQPKINTRLDNIKILCANCLLEHSHIPSREKYKLKLRSKRYFLRRKWKKERNEGIKT